MRLAPLYEQKLEEATQKGVQQGVNRGNDWYRKFTEGSFWHH
jgi:hypothetical protein